MQMTGRILSGSSCAWGSLPSWGGELGPLRWRSQGRGRWGRRRRSYLGKVAHPPHPASYPGEEGRSLSQPGVVSSPLGESPSPPSWIFLGWRALSVCWRSERRGSAPFHCLGARKLRGEVAPLQKGRKRRLLFFPGACCASERPSGLLSPSAEPVGWVPTPQAWPPFSLPPKS